MRHQPIVLGDVPAEIAKIVRVRMIAVEAEGKDRQADVARVAHAMDDARAGQHQPGETEIDEIARHLVDDARLVGGERVQVGEIAFGMRVERSGVERSDAATAFRGVSPPSVVERLAAVRRARRRRTLADAPQ